VEFDASPELSSFASARPPLLRRGPFKEGTESFQSLAGPPLVGFLLPWTQLRRSPLFRHVPPRGDSYGTRIARSSSAPSSGFLPLSTVLAGSRLARSLLNPAVRRDHRRLAAFFHAARVLGASLQSFSFPGSRTRSRGPRASLRVRHSDRRQRRACRSFTVAFALSSQLFANRDRPETDP